MFVSLTIVVVPCGGVLVSTTLNIPDTACDTRLVWRRSVLARDRVLLLGPHAASRGNAASRHRGTARAPWPWPVRAMRAVAPQRSGSGLRRHA